MKKEIAVGNNKFIIHGNWSIHLASQIFEGILTDENNNIVRSLYFKIPLGAIKNFGLKIFEDAIEDDLQADMLKNDA